MARDIPAILRDVDALGRVVGADPSFDVIRGLCAFWRGDRVGALATLDRAIELVPEEYVAHVGRLQVASILGQYAKAAASYAVLREVDDVPAELATHPAYAGLRASPEFREVEARFAARP